jgi:hypothetical protein
MNKAEEIAQKLNAKITITNLSKSKRKKVD